MTPMTDDRKRSDEACPACGEHELAVLDFPPLSGTGYQVNSELLGMGEPKDAAEPGIVCLACGTEWDDLAAFRTALAEADAGRP